MHLWDALLIFYFSWMSVQDQNVYKNNIDSVFQKRELTDEQVSRIKEIQKILKKKPLTKDGKIRKTKIISKLFFEQKKLLLFIAFYRSILPHLNKYVKLFQSKEILLHELHVQIFELIKQFLVFFVKHEIISSLESYEGITKLDINDTKNHLPEKLIFIGTEAHKIIEGLGKCHPLKKEAMDTLKKAYVGCAEHMIKKLPVKNSLFIKFSGLNPALRGQTTTFVALKKLSENLPNVVAAAEYDLLDQELRNYQIDNDLNDTTLGKKDIAEYWSNVFIMQEGGKTKYPVLSKLVKAVLTCFHGPMVEGTFNFMDEIITESRTTLNCDSLDSIQTVKYYLLSIGKSSIEAFGSKNPTEDFLDKKLRDNLINSWATYQNSLGSSNKNEITTAVASSSVLKSINIETEKVTLTESCNSELSNINNDPDLTSCEPESANDLPSFINNKRKLADGDGPKKIKQAKLSAFFKK